MRSTVLWTLTSETEAYAQILGAIFGYLVGSLPSEVLQKKAEAVQGNRKTILGNLRTTEPLILDVVKGAMAVLVAFWLARAFNDGSTSADLSQEFSVWFAAGVAAFLGHLFPIWRGFRGGNGFGIYLGVLIGWWWPAALAFCITWLIVARATRNSSLASLLAAVVAPLAFYLGTQPMGTTSMVFWELYRQHEVMTWATALMAVVTAWKHRDDIKRLLTGTEPKIGTGD